MPLNTDLAKEYINHRWELSALPTLKSYIPIPNKSPMFDPDWQANGHMQEAAQLLYDWACECDVDMQLEIFSLPGRTPILFAEIPAWDGNNDPNAPTALLYGHYDKQPEFTGWKEGLGPWQAVQQGDKLYGRGGADDGYAVFAAMIALETLKQQKLKHPRCILLIEGCEESGSFDLPYYLDAKKAAIGNVSLVICLDAECGNYDQLWISNSLRGMLPGTLHVEVMSEGQHSGAAGGIVPSSFRILRSLLDRVEDAHTGALHASLTTDIPSHVEEDAHHTAQVLGTTVIDKFPWAGDTQPRTDDVANLLVNNTWRPSLAVAGLSGAPEVTDAGNTIRPSTSAKLVFRLPPTVDAEVAADEIKKVLERDPPYGANVRFELDTAQTGWCAPQQADWLAQSIDRASVGFFNRGAMYMGMGGTIPFMKMLGDAYPDTQFMVTGLLGPLSNAHGPNEFMHIPTAYALTGCVAAVLADASQALSG